MASDEDRRNGSKPGDGYQGCGEVKQAVFEQRCQREQVHANDDCYPSGDHVGPSNSGKHSGAERCERELDANDDAEDSTGLCVKRRRLRPPTPGEERAGGANHQ